MFKINKLLLFCSTLLFLLIAVTGCNSVTTSGGTLLPKPQAGPDRDGDWVSDVDEAAFGSNPDVWDSDQDGASDFEEIFLVGSDPSMFEGDSDGDFIRDVTEIRVGSDPDTPEDDRDGDGIPDLLELKLGSDPGKIDSDNDLLSDYLELFLTGSDPAVADPLNEYGFPTPLVEWLPEQLNEVPCEVAVIFTMDEVYIPNPEEADSESDIIPGDDTYVKYGLWKGRPTDDELQISENTPSTAIWFGKGFKDTIWDRSQFRVLNPVIAKCGETVTLGVQVLEDDSPWGGVWDMGTWRDELPLVFNRLPFGWDHSKKDGVTFYGQTHDSDYEYQFSYSFAVQLLSSITQSEQVQAEFDRQFASSGTASVPLDNDQAAQAMILSWMVLGMFDSMAGSGGDYQTNNGFDGYVPITEYRNPNTGAISTSPCSGCVQQTNLVPSN